MAGFHRTEEALDMSLPCAWSFYHSTAFSGEYILMLWCQVGSCFLAVYRMCVTKLDILDTLAEIKVALSYESKGKKIDYFPSNTAELEAVKVRGDRPLSCACVQYPCVMV
jgi:hypothetical protein